MRVRWANVVGAGLLAVVAWFIVSYRRDLLGIIENPRWHSPSSHGPLTGLLALGLVCLTIVCIARILAGRRGRNR